MNQVKPGEVIPDALAQALAGHYAQSARDDLARLYWTGSISPGTPRYCMWLSEHKVGDTILVDRRGNKDQHATLADLRALAYYCMINEGRKNVKDWREWTSERHAESKMVVPWAWREPEFDLESHSTR